MVVIKQRRATYIILYNLVFYIEVSLFVFLCKNLTTFSLINYNYIKLGFVFYGFCMMYYYLIIY
jgi:hypothetical protein